MAISIANLIANRSAVTATSYTTASITPTADRLILASIWSRSITPPVVPTLSGNGLTWVQVNTVLFGTIASPQRRLTLFRAMGSAPSAGAVTIDFGAQQQTVASWQINQVTGMSTGGTDGSAAIVQSGVTAVDSAGGATVTLAAFASSTNAAYGVFGVAASVGITTEAGWTSLAFTTGGADAHETAYLATQDTTVAATWTSNHGAAIGVEIAEPPPAITGTGASTLAGVTSAGVGTSDPPLVLYAHYEADTLGLANGATVTTWPDISGNANDLAQTGGVPLPTYATNSLNGMGGVVFDATHQRIADVTVSTGSAARTIFAVVKNPANNGTIRYLTLQTNLTIAKWSNADRWIFGNSSGGGQFIEFTETGIENATGQWTYVHQQTGAFVRWNQTQKVSGNIGAPAADTEIILGVSDANVSMIVYEWIIYDGVLSAGQIDTVEDYLFNKWFVPPAITGTGASTLDGVTSAGSGTYTPAAITGTGSSTLDGVTSVGTGTYTPAGITGTGSSTLDGVVSTGSGTFTLPAITGTGASTLDGVASAGTGTFIAAISGTGASTLAGVTSVGAGFFGDIFLPDINCETTVLPVACAILTLGVECKQ